MKFTRLHLIVLITGIIGIMSGTFVWMLNVQQEFIAEDADRLNVEIVSGDYSYSIIEKQIGINDYSTGNSGIYSSDGKIRVNLNSSNIEELSRLPGVGPATARRMLEYRMMHGAFGSVEEMGKIRGIGDKTIEKIRETAFIGDSEPIDPELIKSSVSVTDIGTSDNTNAPLVSQPCGEGRININSATSEQLQTLPRVGPKTAEKIIADRETNGPFSDINDFTRVKGIGPKTLERMKDLICVE